MIVNNEVVEIANKDDYDTTAMESFKKLRTNIIYSDNLHVISLTSTVPDEGKTVIAVNLARTFTEMGKKVVFVDCDLRRSSISNYLMITGKHKGLSESLTGQTEDFVYQTNMENFYIAFAGKRPPNPTEIISSDKFTELLKQLEDEFDYVIIDTPPVTVAADALLVGRIADGVIFVVRNEFASKKAIKRCQMELQNSDARIVGVVLNRVKKNQADYGHYGYYGYY